MKFNFNSWHFFKILSSFKEPIGAATFLRPHSLATSMLSENGKKASDMYVTPLKPLKNVSRA